MSTRAQLDWLEAADLLRRLPDDSELAYGFRHGLVQEAAYNSLVRSDRRALHRQVGAALEQLYPERREANAARLAQHFFTGEDWAHAVPFALCAGARALSAHARREAAAHYRQALDALEQLPSAALDQRYEAWLGWALASFKYRPFPEVLQGLAQAEQLARSLNDSRRLVVVLNWIARVHIASGHTTHAIPVAMESHALAQQLGDEQLTIVPGYLTAHVKLGLDPRATVDQLTGVIALAVRYHDHEMQASAYALKALAHARLGQFVQSEESIQRALEIVRTIDAPLVESDVDLVAGWTYLDRGDAQHALEYGRRGIAKALAADNMDCVCYGYACLGFGNLAARQLPESLTAFEESVRRAVVSRAAPIESLGRAGLAIARFVGGQAGDISEIAHMLAETRAQGDPFVAAQLSQVLGEIMLQGGQLSEAERYLDDAVAYYRANQLRPYVSRALDSLAQLYTRQGRPSDAERARAESMSASAACEPA